MWYPLSSHSASCASATAFDLRSCRRNDKSELFPHFQDTTVTELAQDLAKKLGLKGRKAYVSPQTESTGTEGESLGEASSPAGDVGDPLLDGSVSIC